MSSDGLCPGVEEIAAFVGGRLTPSRLDVLETHLDSCSRCARVVVESANAHHSGTAPLRPQPRIFQPEQLIAARYEIVAFLGAGGMGEVYEARDLELGDRIALKTVSAAISLDVAAVARLKAEVQLARKVTHRNVCRVFDFGVHVEEAPGTEKPVLTPFLTMELIRGRALSEHIRAGKRFTDSEVLAVARQIACGLEAAHEAGVLHRDLKSDNVLLLPDSRGHYRVVLTDFGLAASIAGDANDPRAPSRGTSLCGTRAYLAPERTAGARATAASDIYSLGVVMHELVTGAMGESRAEARLEPLSPSVPMAALIGACLARDVGQRPTNAAEILRVLDHGRGLDRRGWSGGKLRRWSVASSVVACALTALLLIHGGSARSRAGFASVTANATVTSPSTRAPEPPRAAPISPAVPVVAVPGAVPSRFGRPSPLVTRRAATGRSLLESAEQRLRAGSIEEACRLGRQAAHRAPDAPATWEFLGRCFMRLGEPREARAYYKKYLALAPGGSDEIFVRAMIDEDQQ